MLSLCLDLGIEDNQCDWKQPARNVSLAHLSGPLHLLVFRLRSHLVGIFVT